jgi:hypothetical protein
MSSRFGGVALALALAGMVAPVQAKEIDRNFHRSFEVSPGDTLHLTHGDGDVEIVSWDKDVLDVEVRYHVRITRIGIGSDGDLEVEFRQSGKDVYVTERAAGSFNIGFISVHDREYRYTIKAPAYLNLALEGEDGAVRIRAWRGEIDGLSEDGDIALEHVSSQSVRLRTEDGDIRIEDLEGQLGVKTSDGNVDVDGCSNARLRIRADDGDIRIARCQGDFHLEGEDGDIRLRQVRAARLEVRTEDGDVDLDLLEADGLDVDVSSDEGDVSLDLAAGLSAALTLDCAERRLRLDLPDAERLSKGRRRTTADLHGGRGRIRVEVQDARVRVRQRRSLER